MLITRLTIGCRVTDSIPTSHQEYISILELVSFLIALSPLHPEQPSWFSLDHGPQPLLATKEGQTFFAGPLRGASELWKSYWNRGMYIPPACEDEALMKFEANLKDVERLMGAKCSIQRISEETSFPAAGLAALLATEGAEHDALTGIVMALDNIAAVRAQLGVLILAASSASNKVSLHSAMDPAPVLPPISLPTHMIDLMYLYQMRDV